MLVLSPESQQLGNGFPAHVSVVLGQRIICTNDHVMSCRKWQVTQERNVHVLRGGARLSAPGSFPRSTCRKGSQSGSVSRAVPLLNRQSDCVGAYSETATHGTEKGSTSQASRATNKPSELGCSTRDCFEGKSNLQGSICESEENEWPTRLCTQASTICPTYGGFLGCRA